jgi:hypothetical protein
MAAMKAAETRIVELEHELKEVRNDAMDELKQQRRASGYIKAEYETGFGMLGVPPIIFSQIRRAWLLLLKSTKKLRETMWWMNTL